MQADKDAVAKWAITWCLYYFSVFQFLVNAVNTKFWTAFKCFIVAINQSSLFPTSNDSQTPALKLQYRTKADIKASFLSRTVIFGSSWKHSLQFQFSYRCSSCKNRSHLTITRWWFTGIFIAVPCHRAMPRFELRLNKQSNQDFLVFKCIYFISSV